MAIVEGGYRVTVTDWNWNDTLGLQCLWHILVFQYQLTYETGQTLSFIIEFRISSISMIDMTLLKLDRHFC